MDFHRADAIAAGVHHQTKGVVLGDLQELGGGVQEPSFGEEIEKKRMDAGGVVGLGPQRKRDRHGQSHRADPAIVGRT